ncbi:MAG TPA: methionine--tRNA ligase [Cytophagaceae bacterium]|jgi:methionyl-tRNA synthetase|nr:methionine--tRNA ligase [Cytophagaceae bacterium]
MIKDPKRYTVTAALIYANGPIHIGHLAGCYLPADIYVRYLRAIGKEVVFVSGTDEHGVPITIKAKNEGITPQRVVDKYYKQIKTSFEDFGISFDIYSRTSKEEHHKVSQEYFTNLYNKNYFNEEITEQYFDETAGQFLADRYIVGTCPNCANENAYGDQCEKCGSTLSPTELINPRSMLSGAKPVLKKTKNWYLPLDKMQPQIEAFVNGHQEWKTNVFGQCQSWLKQGLLPRAMTRDLEWGVKVPLPETEGKVLYVWFDAPIGYITFTKEFFEKFNSEKNKKDYIYDRSTFKNIQASDWEKYWKDKDGTKLVHFIGKDNIVFHCVIFPAMLMADGSYILPDNVPANEFMNLEGDKISTSRNWAVWLHEYLEEFPHKQDVLRYVLCANAPETKDNDFTWKDFQTRNNSELVAILGNFVNRAIVLTHKYYEGEVPYFSPEEILKITFGPSNNNEESSPFYSTPHDISDIGTCIENYHFRDALASLMKIARAGNKYLQENKPWELIKTDPDKAKLVISVSLELCAQMMILMEPFMPFTALKLADILNLKFESYKWEDATKAIFFKPGHKLGKEELLFEKIEDATIETQMQKLQASKKANELANAIVTPAKEAVSYDDFTKMDIRIATILEAERVPKTKKLLKLKLDTGLDHRTVVSGIAEYYEPEKIIGQQVCLLANLAPRDIKGIMSQGMILMAENNDGSLSFVSPSKIVSNGSIVA